MSDPDLICVIRLISREGDELISVLSGWESHAIDPDAGLLLLKYGEHGFEALSRRGYFHAFQGIRQQLEKEGLVPYCHAASRDVYPSPMAESMGPVTHGYKTVLGKPATELVDLFGEDDSVEPATVQEQESFHEKWMKSLDRAS